MQDGSEPGGGATPAILVEGVCKTFQRGATRALDDVSIRVGPGESVGIIGPNGAGKTTLLGCLLGLVRPDGGRIEIQGHAPDDIAVRASTGYLPERPVIDRWMTGPTFLHYHHELAHLPSRSRTGDCAALFERVGLDPAARRQRIGRYSRGMVQRLGLAQALLGSPRLLFLDEPFSGLDPSGVILFRELIGALMRDRVTVVVNSHNLSEVQRICTRVVFMQRGRLTEIDPVGIGATCSRILCVRLSLSAGVIAFERLAGFGTTSGAVLREWSSPLARFEVPDDDCARTLIADLVLAGLPVVAASAEDGPLEHLFRDQGEPPL